MNTTSSATSVLDEVTTWPGVSTQPTPRGPPRSWSTVTSLAMFTPTAGHLTCHSQRTGARVLNTGRANEWFPGWVSKPLKDDADAQDGIALLRGSYDELRIQ